MKIATNINLERLTKGLIALLFAFVGLSFVSQMVKADPPLADGEVKVSKTATAVPGKINTWELELKIQAKDTRKTSDTILVFDRSGSMEGDRLVKAQNAANSFIDSLLTPGSQNKLGLVSFAGRNVESNSADVVVEESLVGPSGAALLRNKIDALEANGGTFTQAAIRLAATELENSSADHKNIVILSDGEPTYSYLPQNINGNLSNQSIGLHSRGQGTSCTSRNLATSGLATTTGLTYDYDTIVGCGSRMFHRYETGPSRYYNFGNATIDEANFIKNNADESKRYNIYTIALSAGDQGQSVLESVASQGNAYSGSDSDLEAIFNKISAKIAAAASEITIHDEISPHFKPVSGTASHNGHISGNYVDWNDVELSAPDEDGVRTATRTIEIELSENFTQDDLENHRFPTNSNVAFDYIDMNGNSQNLDAPSPIVNPVLIHTEKKVDGDKAFADDKFHISVTDSSANSPNFGGTLEGTGNLAPNTLGRLTGTYTIAETITGGQYDRTYEYHIGDGEFMPAGPLNTFDLDNSYQHQTDAQNVNNDIYVRVTNKAKLGSLVIKKELGGCEVSEVQEPTPGASFTFDVKNSDGEIVQTVTLQINRGDCQAMSEVITLPQGEYTVVEQGAEKYTTIHQLDGEDATRDGKTATVQIGPSDNLDRTVTFTNTFTKERTITVNKTWVGGNNHTATFQLWRDGAQFGQEKSLTGNGSVSWENLPEADIYGTVYNYSVKEVVENYTAEPDCINNPCAVGENGNIDITNTYVSPKTEYQALKRWVGGPEEKPTIQLQLYRNDAPHSTPVSLPDETAGWSYTWTDLDETDGNGEPYTYIAKEVNVPENYEMTQSGNTITNTYESPKIDKTATKEWVNGPVNDRPEIQLRLLKDGVPHREVATLNSTTGWSYTWTDLDQTDENGVEHNYTVTELTNLPDYDKEEVGMTVKNIYKIPTRDISVEKVWQGGDALHQPIEVQLTKDGVDFGDPVTLSEENNWKYTWEGLEKTDINGVVHIYAVNETNVPENFESIVTEDEDALTITNTYNIPTDGEATAFKEWVGGPEEKPTIQFQLYRHIEGGAAEVVPDTEVKTLTSEVRSVTWTNLEKTDDQGRAYIFTVQEIGEPENYIKSEDGLTVTNTYQIPTDARAYAIKEWVGGPEEKPTIWLQLWRMTEESAPEAVPDVDLVEISGDNTTAIWENLERTDYDGREYNFFVKETNADGVEMTPANYEVTTDVEDGIWIVTNTYKSPKTEYTVEKIWRDNFPIHQTIQVQLYRNGEPYEAPVTLVSGVTKYTWTDLDQTDPQGNEYTYTVDEVNVPTGYVKHVDGNRITNTYTEKFEPGKGGGMVELPKRVTPTRLAETGDNVTAILIAGVILTIIGLSLVSRRMQTDPVDA